MIRLVVGLNGTPHDRAVVAWAARFAVDAKAHVILVHVVPRTTLWLVSSVQANSDDYIDTVRAQLAADAADQFPGAGSLRGVARDER